MTWAGLVVIGALVLSAPWGHAKETRADPRAGAETLLKQSPLIERYMLDELKALRTELYGIREQTIREITDRELSVADKAINYASNTVTFIFYGFLALTGILTLLGWKSLRELKASVQTVAEHEVEALRESYEARLTVLEQELQAKGHSLLESQEAIQQEYEARLTVLEQELYQKGEAILDNQREIEKTQTIHALWLQANQAVNPRTKVEFYDRILELDPSDIETMAYKADAALQLGDRDWALNLCNVIIEKNPEYALAYYHRACTRAGLGETGLALADLAKALACAPSLMEQARSEEEFESLWEQPDFTNLVSPLGEAEESISMGT